MTPRHAIASRLYNWLIQHQQRQTPPPKLLRQVSATPLQAATQVVRQLYIMQAQTAAGDGDMQLRN